MQGQAQLLAYVLHSSVTRISILPWSLMLKGPVQTTGKGRHGLLLQAQPIAKLRQLPHSGLAWKPLRAWKMQMSRRYSALTAEPGPARQKMAVMLGHMKFHAAAALS